MMKMKVKISNNLWSGALRDFSGRYIWDHASVLLLVWRPALGSQALGASGECCCLVSLEWSSKVHITGSGKKGKDCNKKCWSDLFLPPENSWIVTGTEDVEWTLIFFSLPPSCFAYLCFLKGNRVIYTFQLVKLWLWKGMEGKETMDLWEREEPKLLTSST